MRPVVRLLCVCYWLLYVSVGHAQDSHFVQAHPFLSLNEAATFALLVYHDFDQPPIPDGFSLLCQCPLRLQNKNYYGEAYYRYEYMQQPNRNPTGVTIVIVHRGTLFNVSNLLDDFWIALNKAPESFLQSSKPFTDYVSSLADTKFPLTSGILTRHFIHVGHSLGAIHAELNYVCQRKHENDDVQATVFESPGSKNIMQRLMLESNLPRQSSLWAENIQIIYADVNTINTFNPQANRVYRISLGYHFINVPALPTKPIDFKYFSTIFTKDQHNITNIVEYFHKGGKLSDPTINPEGVAEAFRYYKTYVPPLNPGHRDYWEKAFQWYWDNHQEIHAAFHHEESQYLAYMVTHHLY